MSKTNFSRNQSQKTFEITPLGAAIVEALPDQQKKRAIQKAFENDRRCPVSQIFNAEQVEQFYRARGESVTAVGD